MGPEQPPGGPVQALSMGKGATSVKHLLGIRSVLMCSVLMCHSSLSYDIEAPSSILAALERNEAGAERR